MAQDVLIRYRDVELTRRELIVLKHVDLEISTGEFVYLMGRVGSGKSTLLKSMYAEVPLASGSASVLSYDLAALRRRDIPMLRRSMGIVFQDFRLLFDRNVYQNLSFVLFATGWKDCKAVDSRIEEVLSQVGMANKSYKMPHELSGGEQQRIVIARSLLNRPKLILADEPTGNLDPETAEQIVGDLRDISREGTAVIMATHNRAIVDQYPARTLRVENKRIVEEV